MGAVDTTYTFTATDTITSTKMNNIIDQTTMTSDAIIGTTLEVASGKLKVRSGGITSNEVASNILVSLPPTFNISQSVTCGSIEVGAGTTVNRDSLVDLIGDTTYSDFGFRIIRQNTGPNAVSALIHRGTGDLRIGTQDSAPITFFTNNTARVIINTAGDVAIGSATLFAPNGAAPLYGVRAWVNFDASRDSTGAVNALNTNRFIRSSGNVTSVLKTANGKFSVAFGTAMPNANYVVTSSAGSSGTPRFSCANRATATTTNIIIETDDASGTAANFTENNVTVIA